MLTTRKCHSQKRIRIRGEDDLIGLSRSQIASEQGGCYCKRMLSQIPSADVGVFAILEVVKYKS